MQHRIRFLFALLAFLLFFARPVVADSCEKRVRFSNDAPFTFLENGRVVGIDADMIRSVLKGLDCEPVFIELPWARALKMLEQGKIDIVSGAFKTPEREQYAHYSSIPQYSPNVLFVKAEKLKSLQIDNLLDLIDTEFTLGAQIDVHYGPDYETLANSESFKKNIHLNANRESLWKMLDLGRIDGLIADEITGRLELKKLGLQHRIKRTHIIVSQAPSFVIFSKAAVEKGFVEKFDRELSSMQEEGSIESIKRFYLD